MTAISEKGKDRVRQGIGVYFVSLIWEILIKGRIHQSWSGLAVPSAAFLSGLLVWVLQR
jgi:hypothetical protein